MCILYFWQIHGFRHGIAWHLCNCILDLVYAMLKSLARWIGICSSNSLVVFDLAHDLISHQFVWSRHISIRCMSWIGGHVLIFFGLALLVWITYLFLVYCRMLWHHHRIFPKVLVFWVGLKNLNAGGLRRLLKELRFSVWAYFWILLTYLLLIYFMFFGHVVIIWFFQAQSFDFAFDLTWFLMFFSDSERKWLHLVLVLAWSQFVLILSFLGLFKYLSFFDARDHTIVFVSQIPLCGVGFFLWSSQRMVVLNLVLHLLCFFSNGRTIGDGTWWFEISLCAGVMWLLRLWCLFISSSGLWLALSNKVSHHDHSRHLDAVVGSLGDLRSSWGEVRVGAVSE